MVFRLSLGFILLWRSASHKAQIKGLEMSFRAVLYLAICVPLGLTEFFWQLSFHSLSFALRFRFKQI